MDKIVKTDAEWKEQLTDSAYRVTRQHGTERAFSCVCCGAPLFDQEEKFDSGCGWPSFTAPISPQAVEEEVDRSHFMVRTEVHCPRCAAHLGHVFPDGPRDRGGLRYCINGVALKFEAEE